jgi:hypothetical protein
MQNVGTEIVSASTTQDIPTMMRCHGSPVTTICAHGMKTTRLLPGIGHDYHVLFSKKTNAYAGGKAVPVQDMNNTQTTHGNTGLDAIITPAKPTK